MKAEKYRVNENVDTTENELETGIRMKGHSGGPKQNGKSSIVFTPIENQLASSKFFTKTQPTATSTSPIQNNKTAASASNIDQNPQTSASASNIGKNPKTQTKAANSFEEWQTNHIESSEDDSTNPKTPPRLPASPNTRKYEVNM